MFRRIDTTLIVPFPTKSKKNINHADFLVNNSLKSEITHISLIILHHNIDCLIGKLDMIFLLDTLSTGLRRLHPHCSSLDISMTFLYRSRHVCFGSVFTHNFNFHLLDKIIMSRLHIFYNGKLPNTSICNLIC